MKCSFCLTEAPAGKAILSGVEDSTAVICFTCAKAIAAGTYVAPALEESDAPA